MEFDLNKKNIILLTVFIIVIITGLSLMNFREEAKEELVKEKISLVNDYSTFFTISNAGAKYIDYLKSNDTNNVMKLLSDDYILLNSINKNNVSSKIKFLEPAEYSFEARKMYEERLSKNIKRYYIYAHLNKEEMDEKSITYDYYLIIDLDTENNLFNVTPYNGEMFKEAK